jgi:hypothetical protein
LQHSYRDVTHPPCSHGTDGFTKPSLTRINWSTLTGFARKAPDISPALSGFEPHREPGLLELILGFTLFDRQGGTSVTALVSLAIGGSAAVLGLIFGFREAHQAS